MLPFIALASAQVPPDSDNIFVPDMDADLLHRAIGTRRTLVTEDAGQLHDSVRGGLQLALGYANAPLVVSWDTGSGRESVAVLEHALAVDLIGYLAFDRFRLGLDVPYYPVASGDLSRGGRALGNVALDGRLTLVDPAETGVGVAAVARLEMPSIDVEPVASPQLVGELAAIVEYRGEAFGVMGNLGYRTVPRTSLYNVIWDDQVFLRLAGTYDLTDGAGVVVEGVVATVPAMFGAEPLGEPRGAPTPAEALAGVFLLPAESVTVRASAGTGLSGGLGSPRFRGMLDVEVRPTFGRKDTDGDGIVDRRDACPREPEDLDAFEDDDGCPDRDNDGDGVLDAADTCPDEPEDSDGFQDDDGCPDPSQTIVIRVVGERGEPVSGAILQVSGDGLEPTSETELELHPGTYRVMAFAPGFKPTQQEIAVTGGPDRVLQIVLER